MNRRVRLIRIIWFAFYGNLAGKLQSLLGIMEQIGSQPIKIKDQEVLSKYAHHFERIEQELAQALSSKVGAIEEMGRHSLLGQGKRLRPLLFILCCRLFDNNSEELYKLSIVFEHIHTASLLHDDVLDNAQLRRKKPSANTLWGNHAAVLEGDFLYSKAFSTAVNYAGLDFFKKLTETTTIMAEGQVLELLHERDWRLAPETYFDIIYAKTAVLISAACACGGIISGARPDEVGQLEGFGTNMGIAFQLMDDILDYTSTEKVFGKPVGKDLREGKVTLPLIYTLSTMTPSERDEITFLLNRPDRNEDVYTEIMALVRSNGALARVRNEAEAYVRKAAEQLDSFPHSKAKDNLLELNAYIVNRSF
ncbi:MAG: polyprenyl synthetase family protein [Deltaproteobacteria bacterium]|nr:polyprenyl synthetase family protein [Deltaproteobacteria bacterium]